MKKKLLTLFAFLSVALFAFFLQFGSIDSFATSWRAFSNGSTWMPFSPYASRVVDASKLRRYDATHVVFEDQSLFWKGIDAIAVPKLNANGELEELVLSTGGSGYGSKVIAIIKGAGADQFILGEVKVRDGHVIAVDVLKAGKWYDSSRMFYDGERLPFSGVAEIKYRNGQLMEQRKYLVGQLHGKWSKWKNNGIPLFEREYDHGNKHGTHMEWYGEPIDPKDYKSGGEEGAQLEKKTYVSLWVEVNEKAKEEFDGKQASQQEINDWTINTYQQKGGSFAPKLLKHYEHNQRHGLFEGYDEKGNKIFKDEYIEGKRVDHKTFDPVGAT